jgi:hypothetical protein
VGGGPRGSLPDLALAPAPCRPHLRKKIGGVLGARFAGLKSVPFRLLWAALAAGSCWRSPRSRSSAPPRRDHQQDRGGGRQPGPQLPTRDSRPETQAAPITFHVEVSGFDAVPWPRLRAPFHLAGRRASTSWRVAGGGWRRWRLMWSAALLRKARQQPHPPASRADLELLGNISF